MAVHWNAKSVDPALDVERGVRLSKSAGTGRVGPAHRLMPNDAVDRPMGGVAMVGHPPYWEGAVVEDPRFEKLLARLGRQTLNAG